jgi:hypothetical protein
MTTPLGPRGPLDPTLGSTLGRVLPLPRRGSVDGPAETKPAEAKPADAKAVETPAQSLGAPTQSSTFDRAAGTAPAVSAPVEGAGKSQVMARLQAMGVEGRKRVKTAEAPRVVDGADGRVHEGPVTIESRAGLAKLDGVARIAGSLSLQEGAVKNADLLALRDLKVVEGRLTFEGMRSA